MRVVLGSARMPDPQTSSPLRILRRHFTDCESRELRRYATQRGFAELVGRSESLIRNIESGLIECSYKLADAISDATGVSAAWVLGNMDAAQPIPDRNGGNWSPEMVLALHRAGSNRGIVERLNTEADRRGLSPSGLLLHMTRIELAAASRRGAADFQEALGKLLREFGMFPSERSRSEYSESWKMFDAEFPARDLNETLRDISRLK